MDARCLLLLCALCAGCCAAGGNPRASAPPWKPDAAADVRPSLPAGTIVPGVNAPGGTPILQREPAAGSNTLARDVAEVRARQAQMDNDLGRLIAMARQLEQLAGPAISKPIEGGEDVGPVVNVPDPPSGPGIMGTVLDAAVGYGLPIAMGAAGISFPPLLAYGAYKLLRGAGSRVLRKRSKSASDAKGAGDSPSTFLAYAKRDGTEAYQLLELARMEGQNPILLGYQGLALIDELETLIRGDQTPRTPAELASALRARIAERVNNAVRPTETAVV